MFEQFTERARQVVVLAQDEARVLRHNFIGTEHLLLGLLREEEGIAARVLEANRVDLESARAWVSRIVGHGDRVQGGQMPFTPRAKGVLELSFQSALRLGHNHIGTEHILIGLLHEGGGVAASVLREAGADADDLWDAVHRELGAADVPPRDEVRSSVELHVSAFGSDMDDDRWAWLYGWWPPMVAGAGIFGGGLLVGWLIWG